MSKLLSVAMATYDDYDGVFFTIQSLRINHEICGTSDVEFIVLDNNPDSEHGKTTKRFLGSVKNSKYLEHKESQTSFNKYKTVEHATGKYILILDCHVLLASNSLNYLFDYFSKHEDCKDLVQGPLWYDDLNHYSTHFNEEWRGHMYGTWGTNKEAYDKGEPFEIPMQGMGLCAFERKNFPKINQHFVGFGGEEGYMAEKFRRNGGKNICIPQLKWNHRFSRPNGVKYRLRLEDRVWNYFIGWLDITKDPDHKMIHDIYDYFKDKLPAGVAEAIKKNAIYDKDKWQ